jgi:PAS domain S-box-containing protein
MNPCRIMIVEDEAIVAMDIEDRLVAMGYQPAGRAASGEQALTLAQQKRPHLVLMDIRLKGAMDGISAAAEIRRRLHLPVIFLTAYSEDATLQRAKLTEPYGYILKPFDDRELKSAIEIALYKHGAEEEIRRLNRLYDVLSQVNQAVVRTRSREELLPAVCRLLVERGGIALAWIGWLDPATGCIDTLASFGEHRDILNEAKDCVGDLPEALGNPGKTIRQGQPCICNACVQPDGLYAPDCVPARFGFKSCGSFPLRFQDQVCGALSLCTGEADFFREGEIGLLKEVALDVSFALEKIESEARRAEAQAALRESEEQLRLFIEYAPASLAMFDREMRYLNASRRWIKNNHLGAHDLRGLSHYDVFAGIPERWKEAHQRALAGEVVRAEDDRFVGVDGSVRWLCWEARPWRNQAGEVAGIVIFSEDITDRKQLEEERSRVEAQLRQAQKMEALGTLAGGIAHDFNNILAIIIGFTELALPESGEESSIAADLQEVLQAAQRAKELVQQILAFSRMRPPGKTPVSVSLIVKEAMKMLRASLPSTIEVKIKVDSKSVVLGDATQIHQVLMNLCTNAGHAMNDKGGVLEVSLIDTALGPKSIPPYSDLKPGAYVKLTVKDTGHGIPADMTERIFDPFFTTKDQGVGTGLGLAVVHGIVRSHGGAIEVQSLPGQGTTFQVMLPAVGKARPQESFKAVALPRGQERILVVEDEPALAKVMKLMLERLGYQVNSQTSSVEALETFRHQLHNNAFDLVITDMTMPSLTGADLAREILKLKPGLPIVLCTGFSEKINAQSAKEIGIQAVLMKPVKVKELAGTIRKVLAERAA